MKEDKIRNIVEYVINISIDELSELTVKKIADKFCMSYSYLSRSFFKSKGVRLSKFISFIKLTKSLQMMYIYPELQIREISKKVGFESSIYFSRTFKEWFGKNPARFRKLFFRGKLPTDLKSIR